MKKELIRKKFFKLKEDGHSYSQCRIILKARYYNEIYGRTPQRRVYNLDNNDS